MYGLNILRFAFKTGVTQHKVMKFMLLIKIFIFFSCNCMVSVASVNLFQIATREALSSSWMIQICMKSDVQ